MSDFDRVMIGRLVLRDRVVDNGWLAIRNGLVALIGDGPPPAARERESFGNSWLVPGVVDGQVHSGHCTTCDGLARTSRAAAAGGVTVMIDLPLDANRQLTTPAALARRIAEVESECHVDAGLYATVKNHRDLEDIPGLVAAGACAFNLSVYNAAAQYMLRMDEELLAQAFRRIAAFELLCEVRNQHHEFALRRNRWAQETGEYHGHPLGRAFMPLMENLSTATVYELGAETGARAHVSHCSRARGIEVCQIYRRAGQRVSVEVSAYHLALCDAPQMRRADAKVSFYPPLRSRNEVEMLWGHVGANHVDFVSSDHVARKLDGDSDTHGIRDCSGGPGLETLLPAVWTGCAHRGITPSNAVQLLCEGPARAFGLADRKGHFGIGKDADIVVLERGSFAYDPVSSQSGATWSPFEGHVFNVRPVLTLLRGTVVWDGRAIVNAPGSGRFQRAVVPSSPRDLRTMAA